jgi:uncharacterized protein (TIGR02453 family)
MNNAFTYLSALAENNHRDWYHANKKWQKDANAEFEQLIEKLIISIGKFVSSILHNVPKDLTFKLVRDTRFSNDKLPYNPTFRAHISSAGKLPVPVGYFLSLAPGNRSFLGGGLFAPMFKDATTMIRDYIVGHGDEFDVILNRKDLSSLFAAQLLRIRRTFLWCRKQLLATTYLISQDLHRARKSKAPLPLCKDGSMGSNCHEARSIDYGGLWKTRVSSDSAIFF